jgi:hypothetical protein
MMPPMNNTATLVSYTRNGYGDFVKSTTSSIPCHFRELREFVRDSNNDIESDAMAWFEPTSGVQEKDILLIEGVYYQVEEIIIARRLQSKAAQFIKALLVVNKEVRDDD